MSNFRKKTSKTLVSITAFLGLIVASVVPANATVTDRFGGTDRYDTAISISQSAWNKTNTKYVYIARGDVTADALVAGTLTDGPILLTKPTEKMGKVKNEINRLGNPKVVILGSTGAVTNNVADYYSGGKYDRVAGQSRYDTAANVSKRAFPKGSKTIYVTDGQGNDPRLGSPDGVVGGTLTDGPILTINPKTGPTPEIQKEITRLKNSGATRIVSLGSKNLKISVNNTLGGSTRFDTAVSIAKAAFPKGSKTVYLGNGANFVDAIAAGSLTDGPILLTPAKVLAPQVCVYLNSIKPDKVFALGGDNAVSNSVLNTAKTCASTTVPPTVKNIIANAPTLVKAAKCGVQHTVKINDTVGINFTTKTVGNTLTVTATAKSGYKLSGTASWNFNITPEKCTTTPPTAPPPVVNANVCAKDELGNDIDCSKIPTISTVIGYWTINPLCGKELTCLRAPSPQEASRLGLTIPKVGDKVSGGIPNYVLEADPNEVIPGKVYQVIAPDFMKDLNAYRIANGKHALKTLPGMTVSLDGYTAEGHGGHAQVWAEKLTSIGAPLTNGDHATPEETNIWYTNNYPDKRLSSDVQWGVSENLLKGWNYKNSNEILSSWKGSTSHNMTLLGSNRFFGSIGIARNSNGDMWGVYQPSSIIDYNEGTIFNDYQQK